MKKKLLLLLTGMFLSTALLAEFVTLPTAKKVALHFYLEKYNQFEGVLSLNDLQITSIIKEKKDEILCYYVFHFNQSGFVIVSADNCMPPVLGYSFNHHYIAENQPPNLQYWFGQYKDQVVYAIENSLQPDEVRLDDWAYYAIDEFQQLKKDKDAIGPLLTTLWNQGWPYNCMCPIGNDGQAITGCVATAYAQCLYYWRFPLHGSGYHCYEHEVYGELCADFENTYYRWDEMCDVPQTTNTAIGELMYHVGVAVEMDYGVNSSGAWGFPEQIEPYFNISTDYDSIQRNLYSYTEWINMIMDQLDQKYVVPYIGWSNSSGHFWVCDGYQNSMYFHMNWGWGGSSNGYYSLDNLQGFNINNYIGINFYPDTVNFEYPFYALGADTCLSLEGSIYDGSGPIHNYLNNTSASWFINPQNEEDSVINITLEIKRLDIYEDADKLFIYDGADNTALLLAEINGNELPEAITSSGNQVFVEFITDGENAAPGFYLVYRAILPDFCSGTTTLTDASVTLSDGSAGFNYYNNSACQWFLLPDTDQPLTLHFNYFNTEEGHDYVKIYDIGSEDLIAEISGDYNEPPNPVTAESGQMMVLFTSNSTINASGWEAWYDVATDIEEQSIPNIIIAPNPVKSTVSISYSLSQSSVVSIGIYNTLGALVKEVPDTHQSAGKKHYSMNLSDVPTGVYYIGITMNDYKAVKKVVKL